MVGEGGIPFGSVCRGSYNVSQNGKKHLLVSFYFLFEEFRSYVYFLFFIIFIFYFIFTIPYCIDKMH